MRDIVLTAIVFSLLPAAIFEPFVGIALWTWISVMNPHRMTWGFAYNFPFAQVIALATLAGAVLSANKLKFPVKPLSVTLIVFWVWMTISYIFAIHVSLSTDMWLRVTKTLLMTLVALAVIRTERQIRIFVWVFVLSVVFFGVKGGVFTLVTGGSARVYGPPESYITDNNAISVALVMMIPLTYFLFQEVKHKAIRLALIGAMLLSAIAVLGSYSRGAFVSICAMLLFLAWNSRHRLIFLLLGAAAVPAVLLLMPEKWFERIQSISNYANDGSVQGRFNAWANAWHLALDRPLIGGGFAIYEPDVFARYAPNPKDIHAAHSIYFQMLGEHGFVGLALFLLLGILMWFTGNRIIRASRGAQGTQWRANLAAALKVSLVGFAVGGITVNIGYWDVIYYELVLMVALQRLVAEERSASSVRQPSRAPMAIDTAGAQGASSLRSAATGTLQAQRHQVE